MTVIGLTGGSGAGKGYVADIFLKHKITSIDTDMVSRDVTGTGSACLKELCRFFGTGILDENKNLDRAGLARIVFSDKKKLAKLNEITHKYILAECENRIAECEKNGDSAVIVDAPLLFESGFDSRCDYIIAVVAGREKRIDRIMRRDGITMEMAEKRINSQHGDDFYCDRADFVIRNDSGCDIESQVAAVVRSIL